MGAFYGFARIYLIASIIVNYRDNIIDDETLKIALLSYQKQKTLNMEEIWNLWIFLEIAIIENIRGVCEKIYNSQIQKIKVEDIIERIIEKKQNKKNSLLKPKTNNLKTQVKYAFIEYMSYKLKRLGKKGIAYLSVLENEINKIGLSIASAIKKEHFDIAMQKVLIGNSITSIREISRIDFLLLFEEINRVEDILKKDPANVYINMDYKTKAYYRSAIKTLSEKTKISEYYIANKALDLAKQNKGEKSHIGYYLVDEGYNILIQALGINKKTKLKNSSKVNLYINAVFSMTAFLVLLLFNITGRTFNSIIISFFSVIPLSEISIQAINYFLSKTEKPKIIPKMDFENGIPKEYASFVIIPTIIKKSQKVEEIMHKLEVYYLANKSENLYFALLGDTSSSSKRTEKEDEAIIKKGIELVDNLNNKYAKNKEEKFFFLYRNRVWSAGEKCYFGWERKRGLISQFNKFLVEGVDDFRVNTIKKNKLKIKYVITLDCDTCLCLNTAQKLIGAMAHILNRPKISNGIVTKGYGIIGPRIGIDLDSNRKTLFSNIFSGEGGTDLYANAISDVYQDNFGEGIFTGKGIYDLNVFYSLLENEIPENKVLSHDLLEGCYLRTGLATDILLSDGCPSNYSSYMERLCRWKRGDFQIYRWLKKTIIDRKNNTKKNPLNKLSKFKILDNIRRSLVPIFSLLLVLIGLFLHANNIFFFGLICVLFPSILNLGDYIIFKKNEPNVARKNMIRTISNWLVNTIRGILEFLFLPSKAYKLLDAIIRSIYRMKVSKENLLEWTTAEEAEENAKCSIYYYYKNMLPNLVLGLASIIIGIERFRINPFVIGIVWVIAPVIAWIISRKKTNQEIIKKEDKKYLLNIGKKTWEFFSNNFSKENNFLPPDNFQEDRKEKVACRTSPTNIGLRSSCHNFCL